MDNTIVAFYDDFKDSKNAVQELVENGFSKENISLIANDVNGSLSDHVQTGLQGIDVQPTGDVGSIAGIGVMMGGLAGFLLGLAALAIPGIGPVLAAGPLAAALGGAGIGALTGGYLGAMADAGVSNSDAQVYAEGVRRGGTLLTLYTNDREADRAADILNRHNPVNIEERVNEWGQWQHGESSAEQAAEGIILDGTPYEAEGAQQPKRDLLEREHMNMPNEKLYAEVRCVRVYSKVDHR